MAHTVCSLTLQLRTQLTARDIQTTTEEQLISLCEQAKAERIGDNVGGNLVIKVSGEIAVKCGYGVTSAEAVSYHHLDSSIVRVPRVYRFFQVQSFQTSPCKKVISLCSTSPARL